MINKKEVAELVKTNECFNKKTKEENSKRLVKMTINKLSNRS